MYSNIYYKFRFPEKQGKQRSYETMTCIFYLNLILEGHGLRIGELHPPAEV